MTKKEPSKQEWCIWDWDDLEDQVHISCIDEWTDAEKYFGRPLPKKCSHCKREVRHFE